MPEPEFPPATILVVENEEDVRELARDVLEMNGHRVLEALDVADAVRLAQSHPGPIDLLITDVMMPGATGPSWRDGCERIAPACACSACRATRRARIGGSAARPAGWNAWLQKPFTPDGLMRKVRDCLTS